MIDLLFSGFSSLIVIFVVSAVLSRLSMKAKKATTTSIYEFVMRPVKDIAMIGILGGAVFLFFMIGAKLGDQLEGFVAIVFGSLFALSMLLILATIAGFWDVTVDGNRVTSSRLWIIRKTIDIKDIDNCLEDRGGVKIYLKGKKHKSMSIDSMSGNLDNWYRRMEHEGIPVESKVVSEEIKE